MTPRRRAVRGGRGMTGAWTDNDHLTPHQVAEIKQKWGL